MRKVDLRRAELSAIPSSRTWHLPAVYEVEAQRIEAWLREEAIRRSSVPNPRIEDALADCQELAKRLRGKLMIEKSEVVDPDIRAMADCGMLEREAPSRGKILGLGLLRGLFVIAELALFVVQWAIGLSSPVVILHGLVLAGAAFLAGRGLGAIWVAHALGEENKSSRATLSLSLGLVGVTVITALRASGGGEAVVVVILFTLVLAGLIVLFEALHGYYQAKHRNLRLKMFKAQQWSATDQHIRDFEDGQWESIFERFVHEFARQKEQRKPLREAHEPANA